MKVKDPKPRYSVDGLEFDDPESSYLGDGTWPPFRVFDSEIQDYLPGKFPTRVAADALMTKLNSEGWAAYKFDIRLEGTVLIHASSRSRARKAIQAVIDAVAPNEHFLGGYNSGGGAQFTTFTLAPDDSVYPAGVDLIEVNGMAV